MSQAPKKDELFLYVGDRVISGWTGVRLTRGIERLPSDFEISLTEKYPDQISEAVVWPGDACEVRFGERKKLKAGEVDKDLVLTGYIDRYMPMIQGRTHTIRIAGRSKCEDLVDCAAEWPGGQIVGTSALDVAAKLAEPYGIKVKAQASIKFAELAIIPQMNLMWGDTAFNVIETVCRYQGLMAYDMPDGNLLIARADKDTQAASGFQEGTNVESASIVYSMDQRYSEVRVARNSIESTGDAGQGEFLIAPVADPGVPRFRRHFVVAESGSGGLNVAIRRGRWEVARRYGRSFAVRITTDGWRDAAGILWTPNTLVDIDLPTLLMKTRPPAFKPSRSTLPGPAAGSDWAALKFATVTEANKRTWLISEVTYRYDETGTHADLTIMPSDAFLPEPIAQPALDDVPQLPPTAAR